LPGQSQLTAADTLRPDSPVDDDIGGFAVSDRKARVHAPVRLALVTLTVAVFGCVMAGSAGAAAPTPESATNCGGSLTKGKATLDDPNLVDYKFNCDWGITGYTLIVNRGQNDDGTLDDYLPAPGVFDSLGDPVSVGVSCSATIPSDGVNCNAGAGGFVAAPDIVKGSFDLIDPYCAHIPPGSPAGTQPEPTAVVQLVVSDTTGAEDGPFRLRLKGNCPVVHVVKAKPKPKKHGSQKAAHKTAARG
jgi:hypothetical protein